MGSGNISTGSDGGDMPAGCGVTSCCMISDAGSPRTEGLARLGQAQSPPGADSEALPPPPNSRKAHLSLKLKMTLHPLYFYTKISSSSRYIPFPSSVPWRAPSSCPTSSWVYLPRQTPTPPVPTHVPRKAMPPLVSTQQLEWPSYNRG